MEKINKFDLHLHTKREGWKNFKWFKNSSDKYEFIAKKLISNNIKVAGITNHYEYDAEDLNKMKENLNNKILLIPGIECDVEISKNNIKQFTINTFDIPFLESLKHSETNPILLNDLICKLNNIEKYLIIGAHFLKQINLKHKAKSKGFSNIEDIEKIFKKINSNWVLKYLDLPSSKKDSKAKEHISGKYQSFVFSDVDDWEKYEDDIEDLPNLSKNHNVKKFEHLFELISNKSQESISKIYSINGKFHKDESIEIFNGINIVFGNKGSGKSAFLEDFYSSNKKNFEMVSFSSDSSKKI